jgi:hypothetical protein
MSTLEAYLKPRMPTERKDRTSAIAVLLGVYPTGDLVGHTLIFKMHALLQVIRHLQNRAGYANVDSIRDLLLVSGCLRFEDEVSRLLRLAKGIGLIKEGPILSTWIALSPNGK